MGAGLRVATIRGIVVQVHPTFALALAWAVYYWGIAPGAGLRGVLFGLAVVVAVFTCVVGHELAHGFTAQRHGLAVYDITLLPIGGVARIEQVPLPPRREAEIALAGPLLNVLVALGLLPALVAVALARGATNPLALLLLMRETSTSALLAHVWLANVMLALFNLLPAFPMDGGRIVRAGLTCLTNRLTATRAAVALGRLLALGLVVGGLATRDWALPLVALFVVIAARSESRMIHVEEAFRALRVGQFALWDMGGVSPDSPLGYALRGGPRDVAVIENGVVVGMLWRERILGIVNAGDGIRVRDVMDRDITPMDVDCSVYEVHRRMLEVGYPAIPITEGGVYRGIFTTDRLIHVHRCIRERMSGRYRYRGLVEALGLSGR